MNFLKLHKSMLLLVATATLVSQAQAGIWESTKNGCNSFATSSRAALGSVSTYGQNKLNSAYTYGRTAFGSTPAKGKLASVCTYAKDTFGNVVTNAQEHPYIATGLGLAAAAATVGLGYGVYSYRNRKSSTPAEVVKVEEQSTVAAEEVVSEESEVVAPASRFTVKNAAIATAVVAGVCAAGYAGYKAITDGYVTSFAQSAFDVAKSVTPSATLKNGLIGAGALSAIPVVGFGGKKAVSMYKTRKLAEGSKYTFVLLLLDRIERNGSKVVREDNFGEDLDIAIENTTSNKTVNQLLVGIKTACETLDNSDKSYDEQREARDVITRHKNALQVVCSLS